MRLMVSQVAKGPLPLLPYNLRPGVKAAAWEILQPSKAPISTGACSLMFRRNSVLCCNHTSEILWGM
jgi:hypothetical protein